MKEICTLLVRLHIILSRMQRVNQHARPSIIQVGCPTCCYQVCALDHANVGTADLDYSSGHCHRNDVHLQLHLAEAEERLTMAWFGVGVGGPSNFVYRQVSNIRRT